MDARTKSGHDGSVLWRAVKGHITLIFNTASNVIATIPDMRSRPRCAMRPSRAFISRPKEGVGNAGRPLHPRPRVHFVLVERTRVTTSTPASPGIPARNGFTAYVVLSPVTGLFCHRRLADIVLSRSGRAKQNSAKLDASVGASGPHDFAVREKRLSSACC
jgi:hypothetical protein